MGGSGQVKGLTQTRPRNLRKGKSLRIRMRKKIPVVTVAVNRMWRIIYFVPQVHGTDRHLKDGDTIIKLL